MVYRASKGRIHTVSLSVANTPAVSGFLKAHPGPPPSTPQRHYLSPHCLPSLKNVPAAVHPSLLRRSLSVCGRNLFFFYFTEPAKMHARSIARFHRARQHRVVKWLARIKRRSEQVSAQKEVVELSLLSNRDCNHRSKQGKRT